MSNKHAYLIMAHNEFDILEKLIMLVDDERNDLYIHIDQKVKEFDFDYFEKIAKKSRVKFIGRKNIRWGHFSQIECEISLLKESIKEKYKYYHLISGVDLPIKTQNEIHEFFNENDGLEFIHFCTKEQALNVKNRVENYHFMRWCKTPNRYVNAIGNRANLLAQIVQKKTKFKRKWDLDKELQYGSNWFSITNELAEYVVSQEGWINKYFKYTRCADEIFLQTLVYNSKFKDNLYYNKMDDNYVSCVRNIDWKRGAPYVFKKCDFEELINSDKYFARKFSSHVDNKIIELLFYKLSSDQEVKNNV